MYIRSAYEKLLKERQKGDFIKNRSRTSEYD